MTVFSRYVYPAPVFAYCSVVFSSIARNAYAEYRSCFFLKKIAVKGWTWKLLCIHLQSIKSKKATWNYLGLQPRQNVPIDRLTETEWPWTVANVRPIETCFNVSRPEHRWSPPTWVNVISCSHIIILWSMIYCCYTSWWLEDSFDPSQVFGLFCSLFVQSILLLTKKICNWLITRPFYWYLKKKLLTLSSLSKLQSTSTTPHVLNMAPFQDWCTHVANKKRQLIISEVQNPNGIWFLSIFFRRDVLTWETWKPGFTCKKRSRPHRRRRGGQNHILPGVAAAPIIKRKHLVDDQ